jgi:cytochrome c peroxidase
VRLGGGRLESAEVEALAAYLAELPALPSGSTRELEVEEGRKAFFARGCGRCHLTGAGTDAKAHEFIPHAGPIDTPALGAVGISAPYSHDGRYLTLRDLLKDTSSAMGETGRLTDRERDAIEAYLRSL